MNLSSSFYRYLCKYFGLVSLVNSTIGLLIALFHCIFVVLSTPWQIWVWCSHHARWHLTLLLRSFPDTLLAPQKEIITFSLISHLLCFAPSRFIFGAQMSTGLWWVLWQTLQPCFPQKGSASGIPACPGSPSQCTQCHSLKIGSVSGIIQEEAARPLGPYRFGLLDTQDMEMSRQPRLGAEVLFRSTLLYYHFNFW